LKPYAAERQINLFTKQFEVITNQQGAIMDKKVTVIGAGNVGATAAQRLAEKELCDVVLIDIVEGVPQGKALDLTEAAPIEKHDAHIKGYNSYDASAGSDVIIITAGIPRKPGMSRDDLISTNAGIMKKVTQQVVKFSPESILIIVSNPLDAMCYAALKASRFPKNSWIRWRRMFQRQMMISWILALRVSQWEPGSKGMGHLLLIM